MNFTNSPDWQQSHNFNIEKKSAERKTLIVVVITLITMLAEIIAGWIFGSMALFSDGLHMGTHASALSISLISYILARKLSKDTRYTFGTWKIEILGAYTSALILGLMGLFVLIISIQRFFNPVNINYNYAILVAIIGLIVNVISALILQHNGSQEKDLNLKSAYIHVIVDALTSILAIIALLGAKYLNLQFLDPLMGLVSAFLIFRWTYLLIRDTASILLDKQTDLTLADNIITAIESDGESKVIDLHLWKLASDKYASIICVKANGKHDLEEYKSRLKDYKELAHINIEIQG
ncbi:MAG TPA: cation diffusion facilitator family transporter [Bacteroidales bacterium]|jgi:cation diffusion facilitator family transporter|nr:cation diffusion facilitator family transporter [Bacteroidales bacterium]HNY76465.1 cation diffusion facilitator family transporter [Bacteroidales bacterium]HOC41142.1 cation diffusion facilitator family transporter [Bacteroidales bacterium]HPM40709.1 cation diffusion facilitator family transporter [Bacteroidales bacterium]HQC60169.1 cation diffusion facilitator family transporter [Bacteroidales bacterium]